MAEVAHSAAGISRADANEIVTKLVALYENDIDKRPPGLRIDEAYDVVTVRPKPEWVATYEEVKAELGELGLEIDTAAIYNQAGINASR